MTTHDQEKQEWPEVWMSRKAGIPFLVACLRRANAKALGDEITLYVPESSPNVLTPEEARLVASALYPLRCWSDAAPALEARLLSFTEETSTYRETDDV